MVAFEMGNDYFVLNIGLVWYFLVEGQLCVLLHEVFGQGVRIFMVSAGIIVGCLPYSQKGSFIFRLDSAVREEVFQLQHIPELKVFGLACIQLFLAVKTCDFLDSLLQKHIYPLAWGFFSYETQRFEGNLRFGQISAHHKAFLSVCLWLCLYGHILASFCFHGQAVYVDHIDKCAVFQSFFWFKLDASFQLLSSDLQLLLLLTVSQLVKLQNQWLLDLYFWLFLCPGPFLYSWFFLKLGFVLWSEFGE